MHEHVVPGLVAAGLGAVAAVPGLGEAEAVVAGHDDAAVAVALVAHELARLVEGRHGARGPGGATRRSVGRGGVVGGGGRRVAVCVIDGGLDSAARGEGLVEAAHGALVRGLGQAREGGGQPLALGHERVEHRLPHGGGVVVEEPQQGGQLA